MYEKFWKLVHHFIKKPLKPWPPSIYANKFYTLEMKNDFVIQFSWEEMSKHSKITKYSETYGQLLDEI